MNLLLDTQVLLLWLTEDGRMPPTLRSAIADPNNGIVVSSAVIWEIAVKRSIGKLHTPENLPDVIDDAGFLRLDITYEHAETAARLPMLHRDPFDRMLIAQAITERLQVASFDPAILRYDVPVFRP